MAIEGNIHVVLEVSIWVILTSSESGDFAEDLTFFVDSFRDYIVGKLGFAGILSLVIFKSSSDVSSASFLRGFVE